jgi:hypothetical protein
MAGTVVIDVKTTILACLSAHDQLVLGAINYETTRMTGDVAAERPAHQLALGLIAGLAQETCKISCG